MSKPFFKFKQFTVYHDHSTMKVGTDGVLLGAWTPISGKEEHILDIGTGCGVIALMLAQRTCNATITAIDIDQSSIDQAAANFSASPWSERMQARNISIQTLRHTSTQRFDLIVSNPPFFINSLPNPRQERMQARHACMLPHIELLLAGTELLTQDGQLALILPVSEGMRFIEQARNGGLFLTHQTTVYPTPESAAKRLLLCFSRNPAKRAESSLVIETAGRHVYSEEYKQLTRDFYL